ncbi:PREDICTED: putative receptor-like protein kinase At4g00960 [Nelumbo nucifera]|uniref:Receptor-like protein kinase At4g00960 n=1 Tax=Nelumbo nucifera TaxID=4432 RepID=A0A1U8B9U9_NELNU|nr:PREDICTED: putative receptor-like protein kinase At4g00960 [Nelumbo nucifera]
MSQGEVPRLHVSGTFPTILLSSLLFFLLVGQSAGDGYLLYTCTNKANFTNSSAFQDNLDLILSKLSAAAANTGFYNDTAGRIPDKVYSLFLCRGDVNLDICQTCVQAASQDLVKVCPYQKEANIWYDQCMLRYSNRPIFSTLDLDPSRSGYPNQSSNVSGHVEQLDRALNKTFTDIIARAAFSTSIKFATGEAAFDTLRTVYCLAQCTPDISGSDCYLCLNTAKAYLGKCCDGNERAAQLWPNCVLRYSIYPFYQPKAPPPSLSTNATATVIQVIKEPNSSHLPIIIATSTVMVFLLLSTVFYLRSRRRNGRRMRRSNPNVNDVDEIISVEYLQFEFNLIRAATNNFSTANKIGQGGFGCVYKGTFSTGQNVAVKRLSKNFGQGEVEFKNEIVLVAKLQHKNLVQLLGFCIQGEERLLIYEFVQNTSLDNFIFDPTKCSQLNWSTRHKIIRGIARGLLYLHEDSRIKIIHRDLKASNILLDDEMNPKISDFGMARLFVVDQTQANTSRIVGTYGYMAPEYAMHGHFSVKSDVFSFGVLLLEIVSGKKNNYSHQSESSENLLSHAWRYWNEGTLLELMDTTLINNYSGHEVLRCIHIGLLCVQENTVDRPTMASVVHMLSCNSENLPIPSAPAFFIPTTREGDLPPREHYSSTTESSTSKPLLSTNNVSITELHPR